MSLMKMVYCKHNLQVLLNMMVSYILLKMVFVHRVTCKWTMKVIIIMLIVHI